MSSSTAVARPVPGPRALPGLGWRGNMIQLLRRPVPYMLDLYRTYGDPVTVARGTREFIFVFSPEFNHQLLSDQHLFHNGDLSSSSAGLRIPRGSAAARLFSGLTTRNGAEHIRQRRLLMPTFHRGHVEGLYGDMLGQVERHVAAWRPGEERDILWEMKRLTLAVAVRAILGLDPESEGEEVRLLMERWLRLAISPAVFLFPVNLPGLPFKRLLAVSARVESHLRAMIARKRAQGAGRDALSMLLAAHDEEGAGLTDDELIGHTTTLFVAGHETTASALTWTLFLLDQHPAVLADLLDELRGKLRGGAPRLDQLGDLPLLDAVLNESMRLLPPGLWFLRVATAPVLFGPHEIPVGTRILWSPAVTHRIPALYADPQRFNPRRWETIDPSPYEYMPFGAGPRRCLGATFAMMEMKLVLPVLLQRYRLALPDGVAVNLRGSPLAAPRGALPMLLARPDLPARKAAVRGNIHELVTLA